MIIKKKTCCSESLVEEERTDEDNSLSKRIENF